MMVTQVMADTPDLTQLSIEELMNVSVVSPTKQAQRLSNTAAAVFVISQDDIRRSGVTNIPEALRLAPGVQVARIDSSKWAISIRGFNGRFANKLLVLVDGRSIYTPTFGGVYWEMQDLLLEDIDRIEVIRGPGASLWGSNAVNGVINIITKPAQETRNLVSVTAGHPENTLVGVRHSGKLSEDAHYRLYGKYLKQGGLLNEQGQDAGDDWDLGSGGFRLDWKPSGRNDFSLQGNLYEGTLRQNLMVPTLTSPYQQRVLDARRDSGGFLQGSWGHSFSDTSSLDLKLYYQHERHADSSLLELMLDTFDLELQHTFSLNESNVMIWGLGYRYYRDRYPDAQLGTLTPSDMNYDLFSIFIQEQITLIPNTLDFTLGARLEHNDFTGWEFQPNARLLWTIHPQHHLWVAVSRAVHTPSRMDSGAALRAMAIAPGTPQNPLPLPGLLLLQGNPAFESEKLIAYELGYRVLPRENLSLDITAFYNDYDDLRAVDIREELATLTADGYIQVPGEFVNGSRGHTYGLETAANWQVKDWWRLQLAYSYLKANLEAKPGFADTLPVVRDGSQPRHQISLRSSFDIRHDLELVVF